ncbi:hypothetical protein DL237_12730 [Pseudooceanicola sediminis]|uniref:Uncharacterized protein n=1 Tax=Pseudooceanicola sediminis TaxID=2211117 RepID=A0A399J1E9_9RHOB|nr:hypothetical protein DL237_12730 [Pseudooceanicola sediminis]
MPFMGVLPLGCILRLVLRMLRFSTAGTCGDKARNIAPQNAVTFGRAPLAIGGESCFLRGAAAGAVS